MQDLTSAIAKIISIKSLLNEIKILMSHFLTICYDSLSNVAHSANLVFHARIKYIELDLHFLCDRVMESKLVALHIPLAKKCLYPFYSSIIWAKTSMSLIRHWVWGGIWMIKQKTWIRK